MTAPKTANYKYAPFTGYSFEWWFIDDAPIGLPIIAVGPPQPNPTVVHMDSPKWALAAYHKTVPDPIVDVNIDGVTDIRDIALIGKSHGAVQGEARYGWYYDVYVDGRIDLIDLATAARHVNP